MKPDNLVKAAHLCLVLIITLVGLAFAQTPQSALTLAKPAVKPGEIVLTPDVAKAVTDLKAEFDKENQARLLAETRQATIRAALSAQFNRVCAKLKLDPDEYEWNDDLTGIRKKKPEKP